MLHDNYLDQTSGPIGRVVTSEESPATAHEFFFWTAETEAAQNLDIGHIVAAESEDATAVAVLDDPRRYSDLQSFLDDFYAYDGDPSLEALSERAEILVFRARVLATKHRHERGHRVRPRHRGLLGPPHPHAPARERQRDGRLPAAHAPLRGRGVLARSGGGPPQHHRHE